MSDERSLKAEVCAAQQRPQSTELTKAASCRASVSDADPRRFTETPYNFSPFA